MPSPSGSSIGQRHARQRAPGAPRRLTRLGGRERGHAGARLAEAVGRDHGPAGLDGAGHERRRDDPTAQRHGAEVGRRRRVAGCVEQAGELRRDERHVAHLGRGDGIGQRGRFGPVGDPHRHARRDRAPQDAEAGHVPEAQRQEPARRGRQRREPGIRAGRQRALGQHDALRSRRRARRQDDDPGLVEPPAAGREARRAPERDDGHEHVRRHGALRRGQRDRQRRGDAADAEHGQDPHDRLDRGLAGERHDTALRHARGAELAGQRVHAPVELGPGHDIGPDDERGLVAGPDRMTADEVGRGPRRAAHTVSTASAR